MSKRTINAQIEEVEREIALRRSVYPRQVTAGKMRQSIADEHIARMEAALATLQWVRENAEDLRKQAMEQERKDTG